MKRYIQRLVVMGMAFAITSCGVSINPSVTIQPPTKADPALPIPDPTGNTRDDNGGGDVGTVSVTYYSLTKRVLLQNTTEVFGTGSCLSYEGNIYCWDDGIKAINTAQATYWSLDMTENICFANCLTDEMEVPTLMTAAIAGKLNTVFGVSKRSSAEVLTSGVPSTVSCTVSDGFLTCPNFLVDTTQN